MDNISLCAVCIMSNPLSDVTIPRKSMKDVNVCVCASTRSMWVRNREKLHVSLSLVWRYY